MQTLVSERSCEKKVPFGTVDFTASEECGTVKQKSLYAESGPAEHIETVKICPNHFAEK